MVKTLVVVESPAKAKTIKKYLGAGFDVVASKGHVKDLPKKLGIDIEKGFQETYEVVPGKEKVLQDLKAAARDVDEVLLATDPDREGEAIAWHIYEELKPAKKSTKRVEFHEITKKGVEYGVSHPRALDKNLYDAQRCRRVLDRIVGYDVSALVWSKLAFGLSAGRVQSVALRLIVDREREIEAFVPVEYWNCGAALAAAGGLGRGATVLRRPPGLAWRGKAGGRQWRARPRRFEATSSARKFRVAKVTKSERKRNPPAPYTTSKLQQDAVNRLGFGAKRTMQIAQGLYEGVDLGKDDGGSVGLITYMRTDSTRLSPDAVNEAREYIGQRYGAQWVPAQPNVFKSKKSAQDAHEAIRPDVVELTPERVRKHLKDEQYKLYKMIWERFVACQMRPALYDQTSIDIEAKPPAGAAYGLRASGRILKFSGWLEAYGKGEPTKAATFRGRRRGRQGRRQRQRGRSRARRQGSPRRGRRGQPARAHRGPGARSDDAPGRHHRPKVHAAAAAIHRGLARPRARRARHRPAEHLRRDHQQGAGARLRREDGRGALPPDDPRQVRGRWARELRARLHGPDVHLEDGGGARRGRSRQGAAGRLAEALLQALPRPARHQQEGQALEPGARAHRASAASSTGASCSSAGRATVVPGLRQLPRVQEHARPRRGRHAHAAPRETGISCDKCGKPMVISSGRFGEFLSCTGLPRVQERQARAARREVPQVRRRHDRDPLQEARGAPVLRLLQLRDRVDQVRLQALAEAVARAVPFVRRARFSSWAARAPSR